MSFLMTASSSVSNLSDFSSEPSHPSFYTNPSFYSSPSRYSSLYSSPSSYSSPSPYASDCSSPLNDPLLCFTHCKVGVKILCLTLPAFCPLCGSSLSSSSSSSPSSPDLTFPLDSPSFPVDSVLFTQRTRARRERNPGLGSLENQDGISSKILRSDDSTFSIENFDRVVSFRDDFDPFDLGWTKEQSDYEQQKKRRRNHCNEGAPSLPSRSSSSVFFRAFRFPSPFRRGTDHPCSILVRPSKGDFLRDYALYDDLHVGVTDSYGIAYDFDRGGVRTSNSIWRHCVILDLLRASPSLLRLRSNPKRSPEDVWDEALRRHVEEARPIDGDVKGACLTYDDDANNCFDFVLGFLRRLDPSSDFPTSRDEQREAFTARWLLPAVKAAVKYAALYTKTKEEKLVVCNGDDVKSISI